MRARNGVLVVRSGGEAETGRSLGEWLETRDAPLDLAGLRKQWTQRGLHRKALLNRLERLGASGSGDHAPISAEKQRLQFPEHGRVVDDEDGPFRLHRSLPARRRGGD